MNTPASTKRHQSPRLLRYSLTAAVLIVLATAIAKIDEHRAAYRFAVVFDAGSTATRVHIYRFRTRPSGIWKLDLVDEYFEEAKPGISRLNKWTESQLQTEALLENALNHYPDARWDDRVPYIYRATAGLRAMVNKTMAKELLFGVEKTLRRYANHQHVSVSVLEGEDEGTYAWLTLAFLLPWKGSWPKMTIVDLGGISTQITTAGPGSRLDLSSIGPTKELSLTTSSLHDRGLVSMRHRLIASNCSCWCMKKSWTPLRLPYQHGHCLGIYGHDHDDNESVCRNGIHGVINDTAASQIDHDGTVYLFSYFFDAALKAKLVRSNRGGSIRVRDFAKQATRFCDHKKLDDQFLCLDLIYSHAVLNRFLKLPDDRRVEIVKKIKGIEVSWTLGLALSVF